MVEQMFREYGTGDLAAATRSHEAFVRRLIKDHRAGRKEAAESIYDSYSKGMLTHAPRADAAMIRFFHDAYVTQVEAQDLDRRADLKLLDFLDDLHFRHLAERYRHGGEVGEEAELHIDLGFRRKMCVLARRELSKWGIGPELSSEGIVQEAFRSFYSVIGKPRFDTSGAVIGGLLSKIVCRKAHRKAKGSLGLDVPFEEETLLAIIDAEQKSGVGSWTEPELSLHMQEVIEGIRDRLTAQERRIFGLLLEGCTLEEIARTLHIALQIVKKATYRIESLLRDQNENPDGPPGENQ